MILRATLFLLFAATIAATAYAVTDARCRFYRLAWGGRILETGLTLAQCEAAAIPGYRCELESR